MSPSLLAGRFDDLALTIEFGIFVVYQSHPEMTDQDALVAVELLLDTCQSRMGDQAYEPVVPQSLAGEVHNMVWGLCEWRMGLRTLVDEEGEPIENTLDLVTMGDIVFCLRYVHRSIGFWSGEAGTQREYLTLTSRFIV